MMNAEDITEPPPSFLSGLPELAERLSENVANIFRPYEGMESGLRDVMLTDKRIHPYPTENVAQPESLCAVDGARITTNMYAGDIMTAVAFSANGATGQTLEPAASEGWAHVRLHEHGNDALAETAMGALETHVAHRTPHQVRLLDGGFKTPLIGMQKAVFSQSPDIREEGATILATPGWTHFEGLNDIFSFNASRPTIALPKSNTDKTHANYYANKYQHNIIAQDRVFASLLLKQGELLTPLVMPISPMPGEPVDKGSLVAREMSRNLKDCGDLLVRLSSQERVYATYFKPANFSTVIRIEFVTPDSEPGTVLEIAKQYAAIVNAEMVSLQPGSLEPFAQWTVDQDAKNAIKYMNEVLRDRIIRSLTEEEMNAYGSLIIQDYRS